MKIYAILFILVFLKFCSFATEIDSVKIESFFDLRKLGNPDLHPKPREISDFSKKIKNQALEGYYYYQWSLFVYYQSNVDSAFAITQNGLQRCKNREDQKSSELKLLNLQASFFTVKQDYPRAFEIYQKCLEIAAELGDNLMAAKINSNVANLYFGLLDYKKAYQHSKSAYNLIQGFPKDQYYASIISILALCESKLGKTEEGLKHANAALKYAVATQNLTAIVVANHSLGEINFSQNKADQSLKYFSESLKLSKEMKNINFVILNNIGLLHANVSLKNYKTAIQYGEEALELLKNDSDQTRIYAVKKQLAEAYNGNGQNDLAYQLMTEAHQNYLLKSGLEVQEKIKEFEVKYETEKKEKDLVQSKLNLLKKESDLQKVILYGFLLTLVVILLSAALFFIRYKAKKKLELLDQQKQQQVMEAILTGEETERERLSIELHDGLASVLTAARYKLQTIDASNDPEVIQLSEMLKTAHEDTRRMSHKLAPLRLEQLGLISALQSFVEENSSPNCPIIFNDLSNNMNISKEKSLVLYRVGQELVQNALKHAKTDAINIQLTNINNWATLLVEDNGIGVDLDKLEQSNGLGSIQKRAEQLEGEFEFNSSQKGTVAVFKIPIN